MRLTFLLSALLVSSATAANAQMAPIGTQLPDGRVVCHVFDEACFARNRQIVCRGNAACEVREMQRQNAGRMAMIQAEMQQRQMQDFGNRLQQAGGWLQSINPGIPSAPSIPQTLNCSYFRWHDGLSAIHRLLSPVRSWSNRAALH